MGGGAVDHPRKERHDEHRRSDQAEKNEIHCDLKLKRQHEFQPIQGSVGDVEGVVGVGSVRVVMVACEGNGH